MHSMVSMMMSIVAGVPYSVSVAAVNRAGQGNITMLAHFTKELGMLIYTIFTIVYSIKFLY